MGLSQELIEELLAPKPKKVKVAPKTQANSIIANPPKVSHGPLRFHDRKQKCLQGPNRKCGAQSYTTVEWIPMCHMHALLALNDIVHEMTEHRRKEHGDS